ncbi:ABC transporter permease [Parendozoicomonas haliclonae]|uniref:FtsX-like permease family protein n=1 Tax=Parendozoicomonas haliclonae TaxID=1960125 RepID=A0A1X7AFF2_9GAMM|nr:FtsX-like permease family protein [Parendozoicomonas haliclonae]SMA35502.1 FtsX-like permease family protein [Parendozoicomonas haliclonae]
MSQMSAIRNLALSWRFMIRDWRAGELWLLVLSILMAVSVSTAIALFSDRLQLALGRQVAEVLGADMMIRSPRQLSEQVAAEIKVQGLRRSEVLEFPSVVMAGDEMHLVSAKAVENNYPLRGHIRTAPEPFAADEAVSDTPAPGEAWLEPRLFPLLGVKVGDTVTLGAKDLVVTRAITLETDRGGDFYSFSPRLMFNFADVEATQVVQPGSRVSWKMLLAGEPDQLKDFEASVKEKLDASERLVLADDSRRDLRNSVVRLKQFLGLGSMAAIVLAGIAIAMASRRFAERRFDNSAIMRCFGGSRRQVLNLLIGELVLLAVLVAIPGVLLGWLLQSGLVVLLKGVLPAWLPQPGLLPLFVGGATGVVTLLGFGLAPLLRLQHVTPLRVLRRDLVPAPASSWLVYGFSLTAMVLLLWYYTGQLLMTVGLVLAGAAILVAVSLLVKLLLLQLNRKGQSKPMPLYWRLGFQRIVQESGHSTAQLLAFSLTFMAMAIVLALRTDLLDRWQQDLPEDTPNYFALNIQPAEVKGYRQFLESKEIATDSLYPIVRGRLVKINNVDVREAVSKEERGHNSLNRELNLTWSDTLPETNAILEGEWWQDGQKDGISIEEELAGHLGIKMGDKLSFMITGRPLEGTVTSIRKVEWESFQPNFYIIFPEGVLDNYPASWLNSFYLDTEDKVLLNSLITQFPTLTLLDLDSVISQVRAMLEQSVVAVEAMLVALLLAGLLVMASVIESSIDLRLQEGALIRSLGGTRRQLLIMQAGEFVLFGAVSGVIATAGTELCIYWLNTRVFELPWQPLWWLWITLPVAGALVIGFAGWLGVRRIIRQPPSVILKEL